MIRRFIALVPRIGILAQWQYWIISRRSHPRHGRKGSWQICLSDWPQPLVGRYGTSDLNVFRQIFIEQEHAWAWGRPKLSDGALIIDCGANVGYASVFFLRLFPEARVVAVEPDRDNFEILESNLRPCRGRATAIRAGVWSHEAHLKTNDASYRDGLEWSKQVVECPAADPAAVPAVSIGRLLQESGAERISILKIDIEGAEAVVFGDRSCHDWLARTDAMAIELHDDSSFGPAKDVFARAIAGHGFRLGTSGELTVATRMTRPSETAADRGQHGRSSAMPDERSRK